MRERRAQPEARMESSWRVRLEVRGMNWATKASKMGSPMVPFCGCVSIFLTIQYTYGFESISF